MKIQNLNSSQETGPAASVQAGASPRTDEASKADGQFADRQSTDRQSADRQPTDHSSDDRSSVEIALLRARIQHLELVIETARNLMGSNQDRLLRRLYEMPRELVALTNQLQRIDAQATW